MRIVVLGGTSFLGRAVVRRATLLGWRATAFSRIERLPSDERWSNVVKWCTYDSVDDIEPALHNADGVVQCFEDDFSMVRDRFSYLGPHLSMLPHNNCKDDIRSYRDLAVEVETRCQNHGIRHYVLVEDHSAVSETFLRHPSDESGSNASAEVEGEDDGMGTTPHDEYDFEKYRTPSYKSALLNRLAQEQITAEPVLRQNAKGDMITSLIRSPYLYGDDRRLSYLTSLVARYRYDSIGLLNPTSKKMRDPLELGALEKGPGAPLKVEDMARAITTLIHNENDPDVFKVMHSQHVPVYLESQRDRRVVKVSHFHDGQKSLPPLKPSSNPRSRRVGMGWSFHQQRRLDADADGAATSAPGGGVPAVELEGGERSRGRGQPAAGNIDASTSRSDDVVDGGVVESESKMSSNNAHRNTLAH